MRRAADADDYFENAELWGAELSKLRKILLSTGLAEEVKWGAPCYTIDGANVVGVAGFKSYFGLWFFQGALLSDPKRVLVNAQNGRTKAQRQWRMTKGGDIDAAAVKTYVKEAIGLARSGEAVPRSAPKSVVVPPALKKALGADKRAAAAFAAMTPGRRREYADYVNEAKREETRAARIAKILPMIATGAGLNDRYRGKC